MHAHIAPLNHFIGISVLINVKHTTKSGFPLLLTHHLPEVPLALIGQLKFMLESSCFSIVL